MPADRYNNDLLQSCYLVARRRWVKASIRSGSPKITTPVGAVMEATAPDGYSGAIQLLVAADFKGTVLGTRVTEHHETPGLGDKIELRLSDWITHFAGKVIHGPGDSHFAVKKTAAISISSPAPPLPHARWSTPLSAPVCMRKRCPRRFLNSPPVESKP
jgi:electron transport complex protein RnfG